MSVILFDTEEIVAVFARYRAWRGVHPHEGPDADDLGRAMVAVHYANRAAYAMTYQARPCRGQAGEDTIAFDARIVDRLEAAPICWTMDDRVARQLVRELGSLLYNCITNGGTDFLPSGYRSMIEWARRAVLEDLADLRACA